MAEIRKLGWTGAWVALSIFAAGFLAGCVFHHSVMSTANSAAPAPIVTQLPTPISTAGLAELAAEVSELRKAMAEMNATLQRIEVSLRRR